MKVCKWTFFISTLISIISIVVSIILNSFELTKWLNFLNDYFIGISCSAILIFSTSLVQFKIEQKKLLNKTLNSIHDFVKDYNIFGKILFENTCESVDKYNFCFEILNKDIKTIRSYIDEIEFIFKNKLKKIDTNITVLQFYLISKKIKSDIKENEFNLKIVEIIEYVLNLKISDYYIKEFSILLRDFR